MWDVDKNCFLQHYPLSLSSIVVYSHVQGYQVACSKPPTLAYTSVNSQSRRTGSHPPFPAPAAAPHTHPGAPRASSRVVIWTWAVVRTSKAKAAVWAWMAQAVVEERKIQGGGRALLESVGREEPPPIHPCAPKKKKGKKDVTASSEDLRITQYLTSCSAQRPVTDGPVKCAPNSKIKTIKNESSSILSSGLKKRREKKTKNGKLTWHAHAARRVRQPAANQATQRNGEGRGGK